MFFDHQNEVSLLALWAPGTMEKKGTWGNLPASTIMCIF